MPRPALCWDGGRAFPRSGGDRPEKVSCGQAIPRNCGERPFGKSRGTEPAGDGSVLPGGGEDDSKRGLLSSAAFMGNEGDGSHAGWGKEGGGSRERLTSDSLAGQMLQQAQGQGFRISGEERRPAAICTVRCPMLTGAPCPGWPGRNFPLPNQLVEFPACCCGIATMKNMLSIRYGVAGRGVSLPSELSG